MTAGKRAQTAIAAANAAGTVTAAQVLDGHVTLDLECLDRIYLNGYVPNLQVGGQVVTFLTQHLGNPVPSPALFGPIGDRFRQAVARFADQHAIPVVRFAKEQRKAEVMRPYLEAAAQSGQPGVVAVGVAQEFQRVFTGYDRGRSDGQPGPPRYGFEKAERRVTCYYFYVWDDDFGPGFIKICAYFPYPAKVWVNGHEWAKRQATKQGIGFAELANGFATCDDPARLQAVCGRLGPGTIGVFFERWLARLPLPLGPADRAAGYWWELSMRQVEVSRTLVLDTPARARAFFEALVADNLGLGRPDEVSLIFDRRIRSDTQGILHLVRGPVVRLHARVCGIPLGTQLAAVAGPRVLGRFLLRAPAGLFDEVLGEEFFEVHLDREHKLAIITSNWGDGLQQGVHRVPATRRGERKHLHEQLQGGLNVLVGPMTPLVHDPEMSATVHQT